MDFGLFMNGELVNFCGAKYIHYNVFLIVIDSSSIKLHLRDIIASLAPATTCTHGVSKLFLSQYHFRNKLNQDLMIIYINLIIIID